jgi:hypothetical protein
MRQAHPNWNVERIKGALMNTAKDPVPSLNVRTGGAGVVQIQKAIDSQVVATTGGGTASLSYGYQPLGGAYSQQLGIRLANTGTTPVTYNLSATGLSLGLGLAFSPSTVTVPARGNADVKVTASMSAASVAALPGMSTFTIGWGAVLSARGLVLATPTTSGAGIYTLRVPWLVVPRGLSNVAAGPKSPYTRVGDNFATNVNLTNNGVHSGTADVYSWGIADPNDTAGGEDNFDVRDVGVQELPTEFLTGAPDPNDRSLVFAINNYGRWSNASVTEFDIAINTNSTPEPEFTIVGADFGAITTGTFNGQIASFIVDAAGNIVDAWVPDAPMNGSTIELPTLASEIGMKGATNKFTYTVQTFSIVPGGGLGDVTGVGTFGTLGKAPVSTGNFLTIAPGASSPLQLLVDKSKLQNTPVRGWLVVSLDDRNGAAQADEVPLGNLPAG